MREICLLGTVQVDSSDQKMPRFRSRLTMALLGYLVVERRPLTRNYLAGLFWPDHEPASGKKNLRRELYNLTQMLPNCWQADRLQLQFVPSEETAVDLDTIRQFEKEEKWESAAELLRGDFLEGLALEDNYEFETWLLGERERWRQRSARILSHAVDKLERQGSYRSALRYAHKILQFMPWREEAHRHVMRLLALSDQRNAALKQFELCKLVLWEELGVEPSAETRALQERIRRSPTIRVTISPLPAHR
jgi:DNA-binding SARP family transcriptional activator